MKILFAPVNIASMPSITAKALTDLGHQAKCITLSKSEFHASNSCVIYLKNSSIKNPIMYLYTKGVYLITLYRLLKWCDVVHFTWYAVLPFALDLKLIKWLKKPRFVEWVGSDIRVPEVTMEESKWYKEVFGKGYEYSNLESKSRSYKNQLSFAKNGFIPVLVPEMKLFLKPGLFPKILSTQYRIATEEFKPIYPRIQNEKITIVHSPSAKIAKGSNYIVPVIEELKKSYNIEFILLHDVPRSVVLEKMQSADIFIDQIILGSYASAAIEAMSFGKPVLAYVMPSVYKMGLNKDSPIVNCNPDNIKEVLIGLLNNPERRRAIGRLSRDYVEKVHNAKLLVSELLTVYKNY